MESGLKGFVPLPPILWAAATSCFRVFVRLHVAPKSTMCVCVGVHSKSPLMQNNVCACACACVCVCVCTRACKWHLGILQPACRWILVFACTCLCDQSSSSGGGGLSKLRFFSPAASPSAGILRKRQLSTDSAAVSDQSPTSPSAKVSRCLHTQLYVFMHVKLVWVK